MLSEKIQFLLFLFRFLLGKTVSGKTKRLFTLLTAWKLGSINRLVDNLRSCSSQRAEEWHTCMESKAISASENAKQIIYCHAFFLTDATHLVQTHLLLLCPSSFELLSPLKNFPAFLFLPLALLSCLLRSFSSCILSSHSPRSRKFFSIHFIKPCLGFHALN